MCLIEIVFEEWTSFDGQGRDDLTSDSAAARETSLECSAAIVKAGTTIPVLLTRVNEAEGSSRHCGSGIAVSIQLSRTRGPKYHSKTPGEQGVDLQPIFEEVVERSSDVGTHGEISWSRVPYEVSEFISGNAAEMLGS